VVKPSEETPATATLLAEAIRDAGVPDGVYNVVHGFGPNSAGQFLTLQLTFQDAGQKGIKVGARHDQTKRLSSPSEFRSRSNGTHSSCPRNVRFSNRPFGIKHFQTIRLYSVDVAHGLVLLFGIGTKALYGAFLVKKFKQGGASFFLRVFLCSICRDSRHIRPARFSGHQPPRTRSQSRPRYCWAAT
jgi:Aldehyde dehydrogenase family